PAMPPRTSRERRSGSTGPSHCWRVERHDMTRYPRKVIDMRSASTAVLSIVVVTLTASPVTGQTTESQEVILLSSEELGPYRPEDRPVLAQVEDRIVERTNSFRKDHDLQALETDDLLRKTARDFAEYMARTDRYGHHADGRSPAQRAKQKEYPLCLI